VRCPETQSCRRGSQTNRNSETLAAMSGADLLAQMKLQLRERLATPRVEV
jgi:hypothetical protein